jgi:hypothetical protein
VPASFYPSSCGVSERLTASQSELKYSCFRDCCSIALRLSLALSLSTSRRKLARSLLHPQGKAKQRANMKIRKLAKRLLSSEAKR